MIKWVPNNNFKIIGDGELIETLKRVLESNFDSIEVLLIIGSSKMMIESRMLLGYGDCLDEVNVMTGKISEIPYIKPLFNF